MGLDLLARRGPATGPAALDANAFVAARSRDAGRAPRTDFDAAVDEAVAGRPPGKPPHVAPTDDGEARPDSRLPTDPGALGDDSVGTAPCTGAAGLTDALENVALDADAAGAAVGATATPGTAPANIDYGGAEAVTLASAGAVPTAAAAGRGASLQLAADATVDIAERAAPTPVGTAEGGPEQPTALEAHEGAAAEVAGESSQRAEQAQSGRAEAVGLISAALRQAEGLGTGASPTGAAGEGTQAGPGEAQRAGGLRRSAAADVFGHQLRQTMEAALPMTEAPARAEAAWRRVAEAAFDQATDPSAPRERTPAFASSVTGPTAAGESAPAATGAAQARLSPAVDVEVGEQIVQAIRLQWRNGAGEARLRLQPDHLGALDVSLQVSGGAVRAVVRAESEAMQEWIARNRDDLKAALEAQGLRLEELEVVVDPDDRRRRPSGEAEPATPRRAAVAAEEHTFEVRV